MRIHDRGVLGQFENLLYDLRVQMVAGTTPVDDDVMVVAIDTQSLERMEPILGRWPWQRSIYAGVMEYCSLAAVIVLDVLLVERDIFVPESDDLLVEMARTHPGLVLASFYSKPLDGHGTDGLHRYDNEDGPYGALRAAAPGIGHATYIPDPDGVVRKYLAAVDYGGNVIPSLALEAARLRLGLTPDDVEVHGDQVRLGDRRSPLDGKGGLRLRYRMPSTYTAHGCSIADIIDSMRAELTGDLPTVSRESFAGKVVFVGSTAIGLNEDRKVTPVGRAEPGVLINADAYQNLVHGEHFRVLPAWARLLLVALGLLAPALPRLVRPLAMAVAFVVAFVLYLGLVALMARVGAVMLPTTGPLVGLGVSVGTLSLMSWYTESLRRRRLETLEQAKQRFTDMLVHDLKGQMAGVMLSLNLIDRKAGADDPAIHTLVQTAHSTGNRLLTQIHALLDIRRMQEGRMPLSPEPVAVGEMFARCARDYHAAAELYDVRMVVMNPEALDRLQVHVDAELFERVLGNLVWNALQYAAPDTVIELEASCAGEHDVDLSVSNLGNVIIDEMQDEVFLDFVSGRMDDKERQVPSSGLGLAFCKLAAEAHGGRIWIESPWRDGSGVKVIVRVARGGGKR